MSHDDLKCILEHRHEYRWKLRSFRLYRRYRDCGSPRPGCLGGTNTGQPTAGVCPSERPNLHRRGAPGSFPLSETSVHWTGSVRNAVVGDKSGKELVIFDCGMGSGKAKYSQTVVAIRGPADCFGPARFGPDLTTECVREWTLLSRPQRLMPVEEINAVLSDS
jgi:hypothetical protein